MPTDFQNSVTARRNGTFWIPPHLKRMATLLCEMFVLENFRAAELSEVNCNADYCQKYSSNAITIILLAEEKILTVAIPKKPR